jgi:hypothetical protein
MKYFRATVLSFIVVLGAIRSFSIYQISSPTPSQAVSEYFARVTKDSPRKVESITVVSATQSSEKENVLTVLFRVPEQDPDMHIVGYAVTKKTLFGWYVETSQIYGKSLRPEDVIVDLTWFDDKPVIYGQVFLANATTVEAIFSDPSKGKITVTAEIPSGNFALFGSQYQELLEFKIFDSKGKVLKQFTKEELQNG